MQMDKKKEMYSHYISSHFGKIHNSSNDLNLSLRYYRKNYCPYLPKNHAIKILDLGCGMGQFLSFLRDEGYTCVLGVDISKECIEYCKNEGFNVIQENVIKFLSDITEEYDVIVLNDILEHFEKDEISQILLLILKKLKFKGIAIIKVPNASNPILSTSSRYIDFTHEVLFTEESLSQVLKIAGFNKILIIPQDIYVTKFSIINELSKLIAFILSGIFRIFFIFYGRKTTKIFTKDIIAIAQKT